jgi:hypothetical protein
MTLRTCLVVVALAGRALTVRADADRSRALLEESARRAQRGEHDQALANQLAAYQASRDPRILLAIAATLRDMHRLADAANTYRRYLAAPGPGAAHSAEIEELLVRLDEQLAIFTIRGPEISIDGGPFVAAGALVTRVEPGLHLVRVRDGGAVRELTVNAFPGELKEVAGGAAGSPTDGWLVTGTLYTASGDERRVRTASGGELAPVVAAAEPDGVIQAGEQPGSISEVAPIASGVIVQARIDGKGRGFAGGLGLVYTPEPHLELQVAGLKAEAWGAYVGVRYRVLVARLRPYVEAGVPGFVYTEDAGMTSKLGIGLRVAGGLEVRIDRHLSIAADLGYEHFFNVDGSLYMGHALEADLFVPTLGLIGRM